MYILYRCPACSSNEVTRNKEEMFCSNCGHQDQVEKFEPLPEEILEELL